jgi:hypothetical protein
MLINKKPRINLSEAFKLLMTFFNDDDVLPDREYVHDPTLLWWLL